MSAIITAVFKATIGLLVNKGREVAAERLKEGDVTDQKFRGWIVREIDDIKSKLEGLARKDLLASISFFKEGIEFLYDVFQKAKSRSEYSAETAQAAGTDSITKAISLTNKMRMLELTGLDESATKALANAKDRFKDARREATKAFSNEALELSDRVLAMQYRVMATILEAVDNPEEAVAACRVCLKGLHQLPAVKDCFSVEVKKGFWARFSKDERRRIISTVSHVNRVIYDITLMGGFGRKELSANNWPSVDTERKKVDPLRDAEVVEVLQKKGMEHCCVPPPWSFSQEGEEEHKLKDHWGIATNTKGQFLVADNEDRRVKVFDSSGNFLFHFNPQTGEADIELYIEDVATDMNDNTYILLTLKKPGTEVYEREVQVWKKSGNMLHNFPAGRGRWGSARLAVSNTKVLILGKTDAFDFVVDVYEPDGGYVRSFRGGTWNRFGYDITVCKGGHVMVLDSVYRCVHVFTEDGTPLNQFNCTNWMGLTNPIFHFLTAALACHPAGEHVVMAIYNPLRVTIYTKDGEFVRTIALDEEAIGFGVILGLGGITVTMEGHIAVAIRYAQEEVYLGKVIVL